MALQLKSDNNETKDNAQTTDIHKTYENEKEMNYEPVVIKTDIPNVDSIAGERNKKDNITKLIKGCITLLIIFILFIVGKSFIKKHFSTEDITKYVDKSEEDIEKGLGVKLEDAPEKVKSIHQYSNGTISVSSNGDISVIYINGVQKGVKIDNKKYSMFGIKINDDGNKLQSKMTYDYTNYFEVLNDIYSGKSTTDYYYNKEKNDCFVIIINDTSGRVVSMTYYNDFETISQNLSGLDDD